MATRISSFRNQIDLSAIKTISLEILYNPKGAIGSAILVTVIFLSASAPIIAPFEPNQIAIGPAVAPPSMEYLFGTESAGRDVLSRFLYGGRVSLLVGVTAGINATIIATIIGIPAGYYKGAVGRFLTTIIDMALVFPIVILVIIVAAYLGNSLFNIILILSLLSWPIPARTIKAQTVSVREKPFVESTRAIGASDFKIMTSEILPNVLPVVIANAILQIVFAIIVEAALSFLGLGDPSVISWGIMLFFAKESGALSLGAWWWFIFPGLGIIITAFGFTLLGNAVDEELNPRLQRRTWGSN